MSNRSRQPGAVWISLAAVVVLALPSGCAGSSPGSGQSEEGRTGDAQTQAVGPHGTRFRLVGSDPIYPEGVAVHGSRYYVTSLHDGDIYRGDLAVPTAKPFIHSPGFGSSGIKATDTRLVVVQGDEHSAGVTVFDRMTGDRVARFSNGAESGAVNDVAITPNGDAYVTDSDNPVLYRIPAAALQRHRAGEQALPVFLSFKGTPFRYDADTNSAANGIVATADNKYVLVVNFGTGQLFRVRLEDRQVIEVDLHDAPLDGCDGMVLAGNALYVVLHYEQRIAKLEMSEDYAEGRLLDTTDPMFEKPTTAAVAGKDLLVVNSQFEVPGGGKPPWTVSVLPLP